MVRHTRFSFGEDADNCDPDDQEEFTDEDDRMLEDIYQNMKRKERRMARSDPDRKEPKRHLADADWTHPDQAGKTNRSKKRST